MSLNLVDLPPSSWNLSFQTNESILLDMTLPSSNATSNLTLGNIQAERFSASIAGSSVNLQVNQIETKQFSLTMNLTNNSTSNQRSEVLIGRIKTEKFQMKISKTDDINLKIQQVDTDTAELVFEDPFCSTGSNVEINLNLGKSGNRSSMFAVRSVVVVLLV